MSNNSGETSVWSLVLRRRVRSRDDALADELERLIVTYRVVMIGPIRQELLSGIRTHEQYERLRERLRASRTCGCIPKTMSWRPSSSTSAVVEAYRVPIPTSSFARRRCVPIARCSPQIAISKRMSAFCS